MRNSLILQDKNYISARRVQELFGYSSDYVGQLCRSGKVEAKMIGRSWFVTEKSIIDHKLSVNESAKDKNREKRKLAKKIYKDSVAIDSSFVAEKTMASVSPEVFINKPIGFGISDSSNLVVNDRANLRLMPNVPELFSLPYFVSQSFLIAPVHKGSEIFSPSSAKLVFTSALCVMSLIFMFQSIAVNTNAINHYATNIDDSSLSASVLDSSGQFIKHSLSFLGSISSITKNIFVKKESGVVENENNFNSNDSDYLSSINDVSFNGLAVVPSTNSEVKDEEIKNKIKESFSDEVIVKPDNSGTSGIITPIFKETKGSDFIYVLVPVDSNNTKK